IFGMPGQTIEEMVDTMICLMGKRVLIGPSVYYPTPGTPLHERCKRDGILPSHPSQWRSSALPIATADFSRLDIVTLFRLARIINFIKGKMDQGELSERMTWKEILQFIKAKVKVKAKDEVVTWNDLLLLLFREKSFFSMRKGPREGPSFVKEKSSKMVLDYFFEKAWDKPILGSRNET
ncbi:MAG: hypothetical protein MUP27_07065, partial [Desulfobacterales bacterium]|nr:hypothetical protein [Desulfobacterales bacterium]